MKNVKFFDGRIRQHYNICKATVPNHCNKCVFTYLCITYMKPIFTRLYISCGNYIFGNLYYITRINLRRSSDLLYLPPGLLTYFLNPRSGVLETLTDFKLVKKFPAFYGTRRFITAFTSARHLSLS